LAALLQTCVPRTRYLLPGVNCRPATRLRGGNATTVTLERLAARNPKPCVWSVRQNSCEPKVSISKGERNDNRRSKESNYKLQRYDHFRKPGACPALPCSSCQALRRTVPKIKLYEWPGGKMERPGDFASTEYAAQAPCTSTKRQVIHKQWTRNRKGVTGGGLHHKQPSTMA